MRDAIDADRRADGVARWWAATLITVPVIGVVILAVILTFDYGAYAWAIREDHPIEWAQFSILLFTVIVAAAASTRALARRQWIPFLVAAGLTVFAFGVMGEEISWGQRVFAIVTPANLAKINGQDELNLHNIRNGIPLEDMINHAEMVVAFLILPFAWLVRGPRKYLRGTFWVSVCPPLYSVVGFVFMAGYRFVRFYVLPRQFDAVIALKQWMEIGLYLGLLATALSLLGRQHVELIRARHRRVDANGDGDLAIDRRWVLTVSALVVIVTVVFAYLSAISPVKPGN